MVELQPTRLPAPSEICSDDDEQLLLFSRREVHVRKSTAAFAERARSQREECTRAAQDDEVFPRMTSVRGYGDIEGGVAGMGDSHRR